MSSHSDQQIRVVLVSPRNPLNIGAAARAMSNFGFTALRLVNPYEVALSEVRSAVRSRYILEQAAVYDSVAAAVADCSMVVGTTALGNRDLHIPLYPLEAAAVQVREHALSGSVALLFGSEKFGLSKEDLSFCHAALRIPTRDEHGSMNLGQAVAVCLYELRRSAEREHVQFPAALRASGEEEERFTELLLALLRDAGYVGVRTGDSTALKLRQLVRRLRLTRGDADTWLGILRQLGWKIRNPNVT